MRQRAGILIYPIHPNRGCRAIRRRHEREPAVAISEHAPELHRRARRCFQRSVRSNRKCLRLAAKKHVHKLPQHRTKHAGAVERRSVLESQSAARRIRGISHNAGGAVVRIFRQHELMLSVVSQSGRAEGQILHSKRRARDHGQLAAADLPGQNSLRRILNAARIASAIHATGINELFPSSLYERIDRCVSDEPQIALLHLCGRLIHGQDLQHSRTIAIVGVQHQHARAHRICQHAKRLRKAASAYHRAGRGRGRNVSRHGIQRKTAAETIERKITITRIRRSFQRHRRHHRCRHGEIRRLLRRGALAVGRLHD